MSTINVMRLVIIAIGLGLVLASFGVHISKRMTPDLASVWFMVGILLIVLGAVPALSRWLVHISVETGIALLGSVMAFLFASFYLCLLISRLITQNLELAMQVSLLLAEHPQAEQDEGEKALAGEGVR